MGKAYARVHAEVFEILGIDPFDIAAAQSALMFDLRGWRLVGVDLDRNSIRPTIYLLAVESDELPDGETISLAYMRNNITGAVWLDKWWIAGTDGWRKAGSDANG